MGAEQQADELQAEELAFETYYERLMMEKYLDKESDDE